MDIHLPINAFLIYFSGEFPPPKKRFECALPWELQKCDNWLRVTIWVMRRDIQERLKPMHPEQLNFKTGKVCKCHTSKENTQVLSQI